MPPPHTVSVVIPVYNPGDMLYVQLRALAAQDYDGEFEVVLADNGSTDGITAGLPQHELNDQLNLRVIDASDARGPSHARNVGARHATGSLLLFCDQDDEVHVDWVRRMVEFSDGYDLFSSAIEGDTLNTETTRVAAPIPTPDKFQPPGAASPVVVGCSLGARAEVYEQLGGMDVTYEANHDVELGWRAHREGFTVGYLPEALVAYRYRTTFSSGYRQGIIRGVELARLRVDFPDSGMPDVRVSQLLLNFAGLATSLRMPGEERGLLAGIAVGSLRGARRYGVLRW